MRTVQPEMLAALQAVAEKYGVVLTYSGGSFSPEKWTAKFDLVIPKIAADGKMVDPSKSDWERYDRLWFAGR